MSVQIISYDVKYKQAFYDLNIAWLKKYFTVEPSHTDLLSNPETEILAHGGDIFFALVKGIAVGAVALKFYGDGIYELTILGVDPSAHGSGIGRKLCERVISRFQENQGTRLFLETHTKLEAAMALYEKLNFKMAENPLGDIYAGTDCYMEWQQP
ncbi:MAG: GNAT family N-acetyltransferase [Kordiimonadaceae bacterium]|nr:GNAT family N-acetyltransferase [Kordiimonadaceae bacterium]